MHQQLMIEERICPVCDAEWTIDARESGWYEAKGLEVPKRCPECRRRGRRHKPGPPEFRSLSYDKSA